MPVINLFDRKKELSKSLRNIPDILEHRLSNIHRIRVGKSPIDFWDIVPELLDITRAQAKKDNKSLYELKEMVELVLTIGAVKGEEYGY